MPITLKKQAYALPGPQTVDLTPDECQQLYGEGAKPVYAYAPVGAKEDASKWNTIAWKTFEAQFSQLCDQLEAIRAQGLLFFTEEEGSDEKNKKLFENQKNFKDRYAHAIQKFKNDVLFHPNNKNSRYAAQLGNPLFFEDIKNALEVIVLKLQADVKKLKETTPYDIAEKASALKLFDEAVREASVCDEGAHTKLISLRQDIRKTKGVKNIVALQLDGVFTRMASRYIKRAREQNLGWNLEGSETHAAFTIKNWAHAKGIFPEGMPYVQERYSSPVTKKVTQNEEGAEVTTYHVPEGNTIGYNDVDLNHNFQPQFDALFNARTVVAHLADHIAENVDAIMGNYESALKKANGVEVELTKAKSALMADLSDFMADMNLAHQAGILERIIQKPNDEWDIDYQRKSPLEVYYWAQVYALKGLEKDDLAEGVVREKLGAGLVFVTDGETEWFEREDGTLITLTEVIDDYQLVENLSRLNRIKTFGLVNALLEAVPEGDPDLKEALKAKRTQLKLPYNFSQLSVDRPYFCFESIEDLFALKEACNSNLYFFCLALEKAPRSMMQALFYNGLTNEKTRVKTKQFFYDLNTSEPPKEFVESGIPLKREDLSIYISEAFLAYLQTASAFDAEDSIPGAWLGQPPKKIPQKFWLFKDFQSIRWNYFGSTSDLFELYPPMIKMFYQGRPDHDLVEKLADLIIRSKGAVTTLLEKSIFDSLENKPDACLSLLEKLDKHQSPFIERLFKKLDEVPMEMLIRRGKETKSHRLFDRIITRVEDPRSKALLKACHKKVIRDLNADLCRDWGISGQLIIEDIEDIADLWNRSEIKETVIARLDSAPKNDDERYLLHSILVRALPSLHHFAKAKIIIDKINNFEERRLERNRFTYVKDFRIEGRTPIGKGEIASDVVDEILRKFKTPDERFARLPDNLLFGLTQEKLRSLVIDLKSFGTYLERCALNNRFRLATSALYSNWVKTPQDFFDLMALCKAKTRQVRGDWVKVYIDLFEHALPLVTFPGLSKIRDISGKGSSELIITLKDQMLDLVMDTLMDGNGSADALISSWGLNMEGAPSLDAMQASGAPYFEIFCAVINRITQGLKGKHIAVNFVDMTPLSTVSEKRIYNSRQCRNTNWRSYLAIDSLDDLEALHIETLDTAFRPPIQKIISEGMLSPATRPRCLTILVDLHTQAYQYFTEDYLEQAINSGNADLIPVDFSPWLGKDIVKLTSYKEIHRLIWGHKAIDLQSLLKIHPPMARRYLTNVPDALFTLAIFDILKALAQIDDKRIIAKVHALIKEKVRTADFNGTELKGIIGKLKSTDEARAKEEYAFLISQIGLTHYPKFLDQAGNETQAMDAFASLPAQLLLSIIASFTQDPNYPSKRGEVDQFIQRILNHSAEDTLAALTTPPVPEHLLITKFLLESPSTGPFVDYMLPKIEAWIARLSTPTPDDLYVLQRIPSHYFHNDTLASMLDVRIPYHRAYLKAVILQKFRSNDLGFSKMTIEVAEPPRANRRIGLEEESNYFVQMFQDPETGLYVDFAMVHHNGGVLRASRIEGAKAHLGNPILNPPGHPALLLSPAEFVDRYIVHPDLSLIFECKIPVVVKRFQDELHNYMDAQPEPVKTVLVTVPLTRKALPLPITMVTPDNLESVMKTIGQDQWDELLVDLDLYDADAGFSSGNRSGPPTGVLHSYSATRAREPDIVKHYVERFRAQMTKRNNPTKNDNPNKNDF